jgi:hypothetical protein
MNHHYDTVVAHHWTRLPRRHPFNHRPAATSGEIRCPRPGDLVKSPPNPCFPVQALGPATRSGAPSPTTPPGDAT